MNNILKRKEYWLVILLLSIIGALVSLFLIESDYDLIDEAEERYICFDDFKSNALITLRSADNTADIEAYLLFINASGERKVDIDLGAVWPDQKVYFLRGHEQFEISEIIVTRENPTMAKSAIERFWIWNEYLNKRPCN